MWSSVKGHAGVSALLAVVSLIAAATVTFGAEETFKYKDVSMPLLGNRTWVWIVAQLHLNLAAFILGAPIFVVICEWIGWRSGDARYERLAKEITKVTALAYSLTALFGGFLALLVVGLYPKLGTFMLTYFFPIWLLLYPALFIVETLLLYTYWYSWEPLKERKAVHLAIGVVLNLVGTVTMLAMNAVTAFMNTPVKGYETATFWQLINSFTWWPLNLHRFIANVTFGGFITGMVAAVMYLTSKKEEDLGFYDWMGFVGSLIGLASFMLLSFPGYLFGYEIYRYDASLGIYMMSDRLSKFFDMQGILVGALFLAGTYYIWLSMKRIEGAQHYAPVMKGLFGLLLVCNAIWVTPRHFFATMIPEPGLIPEGMDADAFLAQYELPSRLGFLALMPAKNTAAFLSILVVLTTYLLYRRAIKRGKITWGVVDPASQYVLIFLAFASIWTMGLMGAVRSLIRKYYHIYIVMKDMTAEAYTPTLAWSSTLITAISLLFFALIGISIVLALGLGRGGAPKFAESRGMAAAMTSTLGPSLWDRAKWKLLGGVGFGLLIWGVSSYLGFPFVFRLYFMIYVAIGTLFFILLDARPSRFPRFAVINVIGFFLLASVSLTMIGTILPQFSTASEIEKIQRVQALAREQEKEKREEALQKTREDIAASVKALEDVTRRLGELGGLPAVAPAPAAPTPEAAASPSPAREVKPKVLAKKPAPSPPVAPAEASADLLKIGKRVYNDYECYNCHKLGGKGGVKRRGPELDNIGGIADKDLLRKKIVDPASAMTDGFEKEYKKGVMPDTYRDMISPKELDALLAYLASLKDSTVNTPKLIPQGGG